MAFFVRSCIEKGNLICLSTREVWVNTLRVFAIILGVFALVITGAFYDEGELLYILPIILAGGIVCVIISLFMHKVTIIDKKRRTITQRGEKFSLSQIDSITITKQVRKYKGINTTNNLTYFILQFMCVIKGSDKSLIEFNHEFGEAVNKKQQGLISDQEFRKAEVKFNRAVELMEKNSIVIIDTSDEYKAWKISEKIAKLMNIPVLDCVGGLLLRKPEQLDLPYHEFLQQDIVPTKCINYSDSKVSDTVDSGKLTLKWGKSTITVDAEKIHVDCKRFSFNYFVSKENPVMLKNIESMRQIDGVDVQYISLIGDTSYSKIIFSDKSQCKVVYNRIRHFISKELKKIDIALNDGGILQISCDALLRGISADIEKSNDKNDLKLALSLFLSKQGHSGSSSAIGDDSFDEIKTRLKLADYINILQSDDDYKWSLTRLGKQIVSS